MKKGLWLTLIVMACLVACKRGRTTADPTVGDTLRLKYSAATCWWNGERDRPNR